MAKKPVIFELEPKKKSARKTPKKKKTIKQRLSVIVPLFIVFVIILAIIVFIYYNASKVSNTNITVRGNDTSVNTTEIVNTGFAHTEIGTAV